MQKGEDSLQPTQMEHRFTLRNSAIRLVACGSKVDKFTCKLNTSILFCLGKAIVRQDSRSLSRKYAEGQRNFVPWP